VVSSVICMGCCSYFVRTDTVGYDEHDGAVIAAYSDGEARTTAKTLRGDQSADVWDRATVDEIGFANAQQSPGIILASFRSA